MVTYIDEDITIGNAYGFTIGESKIDAVKNFGELMGKYPKLHIYVSYGQKAGDHFSIPALSEAISQLSPHDRWELLLDGKSDFFNSIDLYFESGQLVKIHRHRQHFEMP